MIQSIDIHNFKNLSGLNIPIFSQVNLISGKNNVGKSSLLEALELNITNSALFSILKGRDEIYKTPSPDESAELLKLNIDALSSLFTARNCNIDDNNVISVNDGDNAMSIRFVRYEVQMESMENGVSRKRLVLSPDSYSGIDTAIGLEIVRGAQNRALLPLDRKLYRFGFGESVQRPDIENYVVVEPNIDKNQYVSKYWDNIALTDKEDDVIRALQIIEPGIESLAFLEAPAYRNRYPVVKVKGVKRRLPLRGMGDGINHILSIILALVNCENGCVLIDEIDNGLHYTVQKQLWTVIFDLAVRLNVQVFATTHSSDCISSFGKVLSMPCNAEVGQYIRLECRNDKIRAVEYNADELEIVAAQNIEIR